MTFSPFTLTAAVCGLSLALSQALVPVARAQPNVTPPYRVRIDWQKANRATGVLIVRGRITNTGSRPLTYTQVAPTLVDAVGRVVYKVRGYLTVSPLAPGTSAEFRASGPEAPRFAALRTSFHEAGQVVLVEEAGQKL